ncbi:MAG: RNA polymerase subunit sigma-24 [Clostridiales bacterium GWF2_36_10]|nr:MAG: RNA polymerase subunit sigma-24 [Clostridiales bacterium GWF2_36_10]HAN21356.1 RNA polymerase subunit sigma-24 [Clostridiales bacterium]
MDSQSLRTNDSVEHILRKYSDMVFRVAYSRTNNTHDAEDVMQDVFLRYIRSKPCFESEEHEKAWFLRVTINCANSLLTSSWFRRTTMLDDRLSVTLAEKSEVYYAVLALPKDMRTVIHLYYYEDYDIRKIAEILGRSQSYVKSILMRARKKLKSVLEVNENV